MNAQAWFNGPTGFGRNGNASALRLPGSIQVGSREGLAIHQPLHAAVVAFFRFENSVPCWDRRECRICKATLLGNERNGDRCNKCIDNALAITIRTDRQRKQDNADRINSLWELGKGLPVYDGHLVDSLESLTDDVMLDAYEKADAVMLPAKEPCGACHGDGQVTVGRGENVWSEECLKCKGNGNAQRT